MAVRDIEADVEQAVVQAINAQLQADGITGVDVDSLTSGSSGEEHRKPYAFVMCRPLSHQGASTEQWSGDLAIEIMTKHLTGRDRTAATLVNIMGSIAYALDFDNFSQYTERVGALQLRRTGGSYDFEDSTNTVTLDVDIIKACGSK